METKVEDLRLPQSVVGRLIKDALPQGAVVSRDARTAMARAAAVFVLHATNFANENAVAAKRKTVSAADIMYAIRELECDDLEESVQRSLELWRQQKSQKVMARKEKMQEKKDKHEQEQDDEMNNEAEMPENMPELLAEKEKFGDKFSPCV